MSAKWPTSVATDADLSIAVNSLQTTLGSPAGSGDVTLTLVSTTGFPTAGYVTIDNEVISYTGVSGGTLTGCTRGADGTTAAAHSAGAAVSATIVAAHHNSLKDEVKAVETTLSGVTGLSPTLPLATSKAMVTDSSGHIAASSVTATELGFVSGVTSAIQTQINAKGAGTVTSVSGTTNQITSTGGATPVLAFASPVTMPGAVAMGTNKITGIGNATAVQDVPAYGQIALLQKIAPTFTQSETSSTSNTYADATGMTVTVTPILSTSHVLIEMSVSVEATGSSNQLPAIDLIITDSSNTTIQEFLFAAGLDFSTAQTMRTMVTIKAWDAPGSTSAKTYKLRMRRNTNSSGGTVYVNRTALSRTSFVEAAEYR